MKNCDFYKIDKELVDKVCDSDISCDYIGERIYDTFNDDYNNCNEIGKGLKYCFDRCETDEERALVNLVVCMMTGSTVTTLFEDIDENYDEWLEEHPDGELW